jgi:trigger factor
MSLSRDDYLKSLEKTEEEFDADLVQQSERSVRVGFVLDELARAENLSVNQAELSYFVADQAQRMGISPEFFARQLTESNQIGVAITEVLRGKAATLAAERVTVTDDKGETIDVKAQIEALNSDVDAMLAAQAAAEAGADIEVDDLAIDVAAALEAEAEDDAETEVVLEAVAEAEAEAEVVDEAEAIVEDAEDGDEGEEKA